MIDDARVKDALDGMRFAEVVTKQILAEANRKLRIAVIESDMDAKEQAAILRVSTQRIYQLRNGKK
jgi:Ni2+-binding GTPase involved in maturation of urease and hydrogenase